MQQSILLRLPAMILVLGLSCLARVSAGQLYWSQDGGIWTGSTGGTSAHRWVPAFDPRGVAVTESDVLWSDVEPRVPITPTGVVRAIEAEGTNPRLVAFNLPSPAGLDVDPNSRVVYWSDLEANEILRTSLNAPVEPEKILADNPSVSLIHNVAIDPRTQQLYFGYVNPLIDSLYPGAIGRMNLDGSELETVVSGLTEPWDVAVDASAGTLYWSDNLLGRGGLIRRASLDGSNVQDVVVGLNQPRGIALDTVAGRVYWVDAATQKIQRAHVDRGQAVDVLSDLNRPQALALWVDATKLPGDFDHSGELDLADIDMLTVASATGSHDLDFDLSDDGLVDESDIDLWVKDLKTSWIGDANLDGEFNSQDLVVVLQAGRYEHAIDATWSTGDWSGDGRFTSSDLTRALQDGGYEVGPRTAMAFVPEPCSGGLLAWALALIIASPSASSSRPSRREQ